MSPPLSLLTSAGGEGIYSRGSLPLGHRACPAKSRHLSQTRLYAQLGSAARAWPAGHGTETRPSTLEHALPWNSTAVNRRKGRQVHEQRSVSPEPWDPGNTVVKKYTHLRCLGTWLTAKDLLPLHSSDRISRCLPDNPGQSQTQTLRTPLLCVKGFKERFATAHQSEENAFRPVAELQSCPRGLARWPTHSPSHRLMTGWAQGKPASESLSHRATLPALRPTPASPGVYFSVYE